MLIAEVTQAITMFSFILCGDGCYRYMVRLPHGGRLIDDDAVSTL
jgi:hypothetical protein